MNISITGKYEFIEESGRLFFDKLIRQYTNSVHIFYRYLCNVSKNGVRLLPKNKLYYKNSHMLKRFFSMNNIDMIKDNEWFRHCAFYDAYELLKTNGRHAVFGGKRDYKDYLSGKSSLQEYVLQKLRPFYCIGTASPYKGNQKFRLDSSLAEIIFQPNREQHFRISIKNIPYNKMDMLLRIYKLQEEKTLPVTYSIHPNGSFSIQIDLQKYCNIIYKPVENRFLAVDLNPNYIGWTIVQWKSNNIFRIIDYGVESFKELNDIEDTHKKKYGRASTGRFHYTEKKEYETESFAAHLIDVAKYYSVKYVAIDDVGIKASDKNRGRFYNRLVNNKWLRKAFQETYQKNAELNGMESVFVYSAYTSIVGNFLFRKFGLPDMCLAAFEISRRAFLMKKHNLNDYSKKKDEYKFPDKIEFKSFYDSSFDEFNIPQQDRIFNIKEIYNKYLKKTNNGYRVDFKTTIKDMKVTTHKKRYTTSYMKSN